MGAEHLIRPRSPPASRPADCESAEPANSHNCLTWNNTALVIPDTGHVTMYFP